MRNSVGLIGALLVFIAGCGSGGAKGNGGGGNESHVSSGTMPVWIGGENDEGGKICAIGIAGRTHQMAQEKAKELSRERAVRNLAGVFETMVEESEIDQATNDGDQIEYERAVTVADELVEKIDQAAEAEYWKDDVGEGPFEETGFTYARACVSAEMAKNVKLDAAKLIKQAGELKLTSDAPPPWLTWIGSQKGARLCAVGFSLPALHPDATFENVVEDIRVQLTEKAKTLVMSMSDEFSVCRAGNNDKCDTIIKIVTAATTDATSKGVLVNYFWYDRKGVGPNKRKRSTYGWGCTYPVGPLQAAIAKVKEEVPEVDLPPQERVKMRAADFFDELEKEEAKHASSP